MYSLEDLLHLMNRLRDPQYGCPWDIKQTYATIVPHTLEEAYEVADAIERGDFEHLPGELGDLLFQVVYYSQLAREEGRFEFAQVVDGITRKLVRRHPHVFPDGDLYGAVDVTKLEEAAVKQRWEEIKAEERAEKSEAPEQLSLLDDVPAALPALSRSAKLQKRAGQVGFDWPDALPVVDKVREELDEVLEALVLVTACDEFQSPDFRRVRGMLNQPVIFDGRNVYDPAWLKEQGFTYVGIGRGDTV